MVSIPVNTDSSSDAVLDLLFQLKVKDVMTAPVITVSPEITMREIQCLMKTKNITGVLVLRDAKLEGIVSMDDIINAFDGGWIDEAAELHMTKDLIVLIDSMPLTFCVSSFNKYHFGRFPVLNSDNELCGIVTTTDVIAALLTAMNKVVEKMEKDKNQQESKENTVAAERIIEFRTESFNFDTAGKASTEIKKIMTGAIAKSIIKGHGSIGYLDMLYSLFQYTHFNDFSEESVVQFFANNGITQREIASYFGISTRQVRNRLNIG